MDNFDEIYEKEKAKSKIYIITFLSVIGTIIIFFILGFILIKDTSNTIFENKRTIYSLEVNEDNRDKIIEILKNNNCEYCESMYKLEYSFWFPHNENTKIYCKDSENIDLYKNNGELEDFIRENGTRES